MYVLNILSRGDVKMFQIHVRVEAPLKSVSAIDFIFFQVSVQCPSSHPYAFTSGLHCCKFYRKADGNILKYRDSADSCIGNVKVKLDNPDPKVKARDYKGDPNLIEIHVQMLFFPSWAHPLHFQLPAIAQPQASQNYQLSGTAASFGRQVTALFVGK